MQATRLIALFTLNEGIEALDYETWARKIDLPTVNALPSVASFEVFRATAVLGSTDKPPYQYIEIIDVKDMDQFGGDIATPAMTRIAAEFQAMAKVTFIQTERLD